jgi:hypothetical protein
MVIFYEARRYIVLPCDTGATIKVKIAGAAGFVLDIAR